ncbi:MAG: AAA family ATPase [Methanobrevibacter sp.]|jgi:predicted ATPase|nr:AAA family ATPase [Candidatus Methanovirga aequatorialis]
MLTQIKISNFKSFNNATINLNDFNVLIGANGSGKSNFMSIFAFLNDIVNKDLDDAIAIQGGIKYLKNLNNSCDVPLTIELKANEIFMFPLTKKNEIYHVEISDLDYSFQLEFKDNLEDYEIINEEVVLRGIFYKSDVKPRKGFINPDEIKKKKSGKQYGIEFIMSNSKGNINAELINQDKLPITKEDIIPDSIFNLISTVTKQHPEMSILNSPLSDLPIRWSSIFRNITFYDIDPKICKQHTKISSEKRLNENGENLAIVVREIMKNDKLKSKFLNLVKDLLPVIQNIDTEQFVDNNSIIFKIIEKYSNKTFIPAGLSSDGTNNLIASIIALYFTKSSLTLIEEPERNIHPKLISKLVQMMDEASKKKQIIVTTHNPELLKHTDIKNILFISRDEKGFSNVLNISESEDVKIFLNEEIGIDDLFIDDLLM